MSANMTFFVKAIWDKEAEVFVSESNIKGLHIETETINGFEEVMNDVIRELIFANHIQGPEFPTKTIGDLVSTVIWQPPVDENRLFREAVAR